MAADRPGRPSARITIAHQARQDASALRDFGPAMSGCNSGHRALFDHLIGARQHCRWNCETQCFGGFEIDHQLVLSRRLHWKVTRLLALEDAVDIAGGAMVLLDPIS